MRKSNVPPGNDNLSPLLRDVLDRLGKWEVIDGAGEDARQVEASIAKT